MDYACWVNILKQKGERRQLWIYSVKHWNINNFREGKQGREGYRQQTGGGGGLAILTLSLKLAVQLDVGVVQSIIFNRKASVYPTPPSILQRFWHNTVFLLLHRSKDDRWLAEEFHARISKCRCTQYRENERKMTNLKSLIVVLFEEVRF